MRKPKQATALGRYVLAHMGAQGYHKQVDLARAAGISDSTVTRLLYAEIAPERDTLDQVAAALGLDIDEFAATARNLIAGRTDAAPPPPPAIHPLAAELGRMLAKNSPLPKKERDALETLVDRVMDPHRSAMRQRRDA